DDEWGEQHDFDHGDARLGAAVAPWSSHHDQLSGMKRSTGPVLVSVTDRSVQKSSEGSLACTVTDTFQSLPFWVDVALMPLTGSRFSRFGASWSTHPRALFFASADQFSPGLAASARATRSPSCAAAMATCRAKK